MANESGGCGCAVVLIMIIAVSINYELVNDFAGGISVWIIIVALIVVAIVCGLLGALGSILNDIFGK
jgi:hypothetical protein